jgi:hypothetical protein
MPLPSSGTISLSQVSVELGASSTSIRSLNDSTTRTLFGVASGAISMSQGYGKANQFAFTISSAQTNANLRTLAVNAGWNQSSKVVATISSGIVFSSTTVGTPALTINGSFPGGIDLINNGDIVGRGGAGGSGSVVTINAGGAGSVGLSISVPVNITNNGTIGGGGGGGGSGRYLITSIGCSNYEAYGGTGGGGAGFGTGANNGTLTTGGAGGAGSTNFGTGGSGGAGGSRGATGSSGQGTSNGGGASGGAGGAAVTGSANATWIATGTRLGAIQ